MALTALVVTVGTCFNHVPEAAPELKNLFQVPRPWRCVLGIFTATAALVAAAWIQLVHRDSAGTAGLPIFLACITTATSVWAFTSGTEAAPRSAPWTDALKGSSVAAFILVGAVLLDEGLLRPLFGYSVTVARGPYLMFVAAFALLGAWTWRTTRVHFALAIAPALIAFFAGVSPFGEEREPIGHLGLRLLLTFTLVDLGMAIVISAALWRQGVIGFGRAAAGAGLMLAALFAGLFVLVFIAGIALAISEESVEFALIVALSACGALGASAYFLFIHRGLKPAVEGRTERTGWGPAALLFIPVFWLISVQVYAAPTFRYDLSSLGVPLAAYVGWRFGRWGNFAVFIGGMAWISSYMAGGFNTPGSLGTYALMIAIARLFSDTRHATLMLERRTPTLSLLLLLALMFGFGLQIASGPWRLSIVAEPYSYYVLFMLGLAGMDWRRPLSVALAVGALGFIARLFDAGSFRSGQLTYFVPVSSVATLLAVPFCFWMGRCMHMALFTSPVRQPPWAFWTSPLGMLVLLAVGVTYATWLDVYWQQPGMPRIPLELLTYSGVAAVAFTAGVLHGWRGFGWTAAVALGLGLVVPVAIAAIEAAGLIERMNYSLGPLRINFSGSISPFVVVGAIAFASMGARVRAAFASPSAKAMSQQSGFTT
jgi:hypothetical protein